MNIFILAIIYLLFEIISSENNKCSEIAKCDDKIQKENICVVYKTENQIAYYYVTQCSSGTVCEKNNLKVVNDLKCVSKNEIERYLDKEQCDTNNVCYSNNCDMKKNQCIGKGKKDLCSNSAECANGLYCKIETNTCEELVKVAGDCIEDNDCVVNAGCNSLTKKCVDYYSIAIGQEVGQETTDKDLCITGFSYQFYPDSNAQCAEKNLTSSDECSNEQTYCEYKITTKNKTKIIKEECKCSLNYLNKRFCSLGTNNLSNDELIKIIKEIKDGHTLKRKRPLDNYKRKVVLKVSQYPKFKDVDECIIALFLTNSYIKYSIYVCIISFVFLF